MQMTFRPNIKIEAKEYTIHGNFCDKTNKFVYKTSYDPDSIYSAIPYKFKKDLLFSHTWDGYNDLINLTKKQLA